MPVLRELGDGSRGRAVEEDVGRWRIYADKPNGDQLESKDTFTTLHEATRAWHAGTIEFVIVA